MPREANEMNPTGWAGSRPFPSGQQTRLPTGLASLALPSVGKPSRRTSVDEVVQLVPPESAAMSARVNEAEQLPKLPPVGAASARTSQEESARLPPALRLPEFPTAGKEESAHLVPKPPLREKARDHVPARKRILIELKREAVADDLDRPDGGDTELPALELERLPMPPREVREARECRPGKPRRAHRQLIAQQQQQQQGGQQAEQHFPTTTKRAQQQKQTMRALDTDASPQEQHVVSDPAFLRLPALASSIKGGVRLPSKLQMRIDEMLRADPNSAEAFGERIAAALETITAKPQVPIGANPFAQHQGQASHTEAARQLKMARRARREADAASRRVARSSQEQDEDLPEDYDREDKDDEVGPDVSAEAKENCEANAKILAAAEADTVAEAETEAKTGKQISAAKDGKATFAKENASLGAAGGNEGGNDGSGAAASTANLADAKAGHPGTKAKKKAGVKVGFEPHGSPKGPAAEEGNALFAAFADPKSESSPGRKPKQETKEMKAFLKQVEPTKGEEDTTGKARTSKKQLASAGADMAQAVVDAPELPRLKRKHLASALHKIR